MLPSVMFSDFIYRSFVSYVSVCAVWDSLYHKDGKDSSIFFSDLAEYAPLSAYTDKNGKGSGRMGGKMERNLYRKVWQCKQNPWFHRLRTCLKEASLALNRKKTGQKRKKGKEI